MPISVPYPGVRASRIGAARVSPDILVIVLVAAALFWVTYDNGSYSLESRGALAVAVWWGVLVAIVFGLAPQAPVTRASLALGSLFVAFAGWTLVSLIW